MILMYTCYSLSSTHCMCCLPHSIRSGFHTTLSFSPGREPAAVRFRLFNPLTRPRPKNRGLLQSGENSRHHPQEMNPRQPRLAGSLKDSVEDAC
ncbi:hypothetical protein GW17_00054585 [Ensete ventricosum]|nr:hypothetical protein GW17_00054585 [Ensete ventricosum]